MCIAVRALKMHGGGPAVTAGKPLDHAYTNEDVALVKAGCCNLARHISNTRKYGVPVVVAINKFASDADSELQAVKEAALEAGGAFANIRYCRVCYELCYHCFWSKCGHADS